MTRVRRGPATLGLERTSPFLSSAPFIQCMHLYSSLLITLNIWKALVNECRRDISLLSSSLMVSLDSSLASLPHDLEVSAKVATVVCVQCLQVHSRPEQLLVYSMGNILYRTVRHRCLVDKGLHFNDAAFCGHVFGQCAEG